MKPFFRIPDQVIFSCVLLIDKHIFQIEHKLLRIPTGGRLTSWLFTQRDRGGKLVTTENESRWRGRLEYLNQGLQDFKFSALNHSATQPPVNMEIFFLFSFLFVTHTGYNTLRLLTPLYKAKTHTCITYKYF